MGMQLTFREYQDKVKACWLGKNIGGTLGTPFECIRGGSSGFQSLTRNPI